MNRSWSRSDHFSIGAKVRRFFFSPATRYTLLTFFTKSAFHGHFITYPWPPQKLAVVERPFECCAPPASQPSRMADVCFCSLHALAADNPAGRRKKNRALTLLQWSSRVPEPKIGLTAATWPNHRPNQILLAFLAGAYRGWRRAPFNGAFCAAKARKCVVLAGIWRSEKPSSSCNFRARVGGIPGFIPR